jgi:hypothetical protein
MCILFYTLFCKIANKIGAGDDGKDLRQNKKFGTKTGKPATAPRRLLSPFSPFFVAKSTVSQCYLVFPAKSKKKRKNP